MKRIRVTTILLVMVSATLALLIVRLWKRGQDAVNEPAQLAAPPLSLPDLTALSSVPMRSVDIATIRDQAVFYTARSFYRPPAAPVEVPAPDYEMAGTLRLADGKRIAFVKRKADQSSRTLHLGDDLEGWRVQLIDPDRIVLDRNEQSAELRSRAGVSGSGLIRGASTPRTVQSGTRVLGGAGSGSTLGGPAGSGQVRLYRPPPGAN